LKFKTKGNKTDANTLDARPFLAEHSTQLHASYVDYSCFVFCTPRGCNVHCG